MRALVTLAMMGLVVAGCGSARDVSSQVRPAPTPSGEPTPYPVAFEKEEQDLNLIFVTGEPARALARLRPGERWLERYYERSSEEPLGTAGTAMLE